VAGAPAAEAAPGLDPPSSDISLDQCGERTVLYIEDNSANLELVERILHRFPSIRVISATRGEQGLELARERRPDLILLDLHLPDIRGHEVLGRLLADPATREIPVIILTADVTGGQAKRLLSAGAHSYLAKPIDRRKLLVTMQACLKDKDSVSA